MIFFGKFFLFCCVFLGVSLSSVYAAKDESCKLVNYTQDNTYYYSTYSECSTDYCFEKSTVWGDCSYVSGCTSYWNTSTRSYWYKRVCECPYQKWNFPCDATSSDNYWHFLCDRQNSDYGMCANLNSSSGCGEKDGVCGSTSSYCCTPSHNSPAGLTSWTRYSVRCIIEKEDYYGGLYSYPSAGDACSIGDKCLEVNHTSVGGNKSGSDEKETGLRVNGSISTCSCEDYGKQYKVCCSNTPFAGPVQCYQTYYDSIDPPEGGCPGGSSPIQRTNYVGTTVGCPDEGARSKFKSADGTCKDPWISDGVFNPELVDQMCPSNSPPTLSNIVVKNSAGTLVAAETNRNHICQSVFSDKTVVFEATLTDANGYSDVNLSSVRLRLGSNVYGPPTLVSQSGNDVIVDFAFTSSSVVPSGLNLMEVFVADNHGADNDWEDKSRSFKFWNCQVPVSGGLYDGSKGGYICPNFGNSPAVKANFTSLYFKENSVDSGVETDVTTSAATYSSKSGQYFVWGSNKMYSAQFNTDLAADMNTIDTRLNNSCSQDMGSFGIESVVDPYVAIPSLTADFLATIDQDAWFQTVNGGILGKMSVTGRVPVTCKLPSCSPGMSINALVAAPTINNTTDVPYSYPNNWYTRFALIPEINYYEKYNTLGVGEKINEDLIDLSDYNEGLVLVDGNININQDKTISTGGFLMLVASGDITIDPNVTRFDGILVGKNINIGGTNSEQLIINGSLYGQNQVNISRSYVDKRSNNISPAVEVNFRPDFIFKIPNEISNKVTNWKWGN
ncbi:MAG: hypothetical protein PHX34_01610 [Candidatus Shapirobacteria bacterium]|nr:hypothetical protein [Candidatus Shapirobacteria bacterium]